MKRAASRPAATNGQTSWPKTERVKTSFKGVLCDSTGQQSRRAKPSPATSGASSSRQMEENDGRTSLHNSKNGVRRNGRLKRGVPAQADAQWKTVILRRVWQTCKRRCREGKIGLQAMVRRRQSWLALDAWSIWQRTLGEQARPQSHLFAQTGCFV